MYGSVLSGGFAGHVYGAEGIWSADIEAAAPVKMWDAFRWRSGNDMRFLPQFMLSIGKRYQDLVPDDWVVPSRTPATKSYEGWAFAARTPDQAIFLAYFEKGATAPALIRGGRPEGSYRARWFDPRTGRWSDAGKGVIEADVIGEIALPPFPSGEDWALQLVAEPPALRP